MTSNRYPERPFRHQLAELTHLSTDDELTPSEAYVKLREAMAQLSLRTDTYASSSITSGGHARRRVSDTGLPMSEVIESNTRTAFQVCDGLFASQQMDPAETIEAVALGYIPHWSQSDYMEFWLATMAGLPATGHGVSRAVDTFQADFMARRQQAIDNGRLDMDIYNSSAQAVETRASHYFVHAHLFADAVLESPTEIEPIRRLVGVVDPGMSLGAQTEKLFASRMEAQLFRVAIARTGLEPTEKSAPLQLVEDSQLIARLGGSVFDLKPRELMVLVPQDEQ
jgi:hypothetical protein